MPVQPGPVRRADPPRRPGVVRGDPERGAPRARGCRRRPRLTAWEQPLADRVVVDLSTGIAGGYCSKLLADAGATVVKLEAPGGDPLRHREDPKGDRADNALFRFLAAGKQSVLVDTGREADVELALTVLSHADVVIWSGESAFSTHPRLTPTALRATLPRLVVTTITPFGLEGPWAGRPATEFTLQAWAGAIGWRGVPGRPPISTGGRVGEWAAGVYAGTGALAALRRRGATGVGELVDVAVYDAVALTLTNMHPLSYASQAGRPRDPAPTSLLPGIHPTRDGWVGFMTVTGQQWLDFCLLLERYDWLEDESLIRARVREERRAEVTTAIETWTRERSTADVLVAAAELRVPVAPIGNGATIPALDHFIDQGMLVMSGDGAFLQPRSPVQLGGVPPLPPRPAPRLGEHTAAWRGRGSAAAGASEAAGPRVGGGGGLPFAGLRIVDLTAFWAGPSTSQFFAMLGAEVIKVESSSRPDGMRNLSLLEPGAPSWLEHSPLFHATNTNKLGLDLRLDRPEGRDLLRELIACSDVLIENFSPRVLEGWELTHEALREANPSLIVVRMPAFGLSGPWRDRTGFAQTMEQVSGMAWVTGYSDGPPVVPSGCCDPIAGAHGALALELALEVRERTGRGVAVEVPMVLSALNVAAEQVIERSAYGHLIERAGNRGHTAAPQDLYAAEHDPDDPLGGLVAIAVESGEHWGRLCRVIPELDGLVAAPSSLASRRAAVASIDAVLRPWCARRSVVTIVDVLCRAGVPVGHVRMPHDPERTQLAARGFFEQVSHPVAPPTTIVGLPMRFGNGPHPLHRTAAPLLGGSTVQVLQEILGKSPQECDDLHLAGVVGGFG